MTAATIAEVLLQRAIACCEVGIVVSGVVRVCHRDCLFVVVFDDGYDRSELIVVACENDQDPNESQEAILARLGSSERGGYPLPYECALN